MDCQLVTLLTADDLTGMRATANESLPDAAVIFSLTQDQDDDDKSGFTEEWVPSDEDDPPVVACRLAPLVGGVGGANTETVLAARIGGAVAWMVTLPVGTAVTETDRIVIGDRGFEVALVLGDRSWEVLRRVIVTEML